jgi:hypothetical protein
MNTELEEYASVLEDRLINVNTCPFIVAYVVYEFSFLKNNFRSLPYRSFIEWFHWADTPQGAMFWAFVDDILYGCSPLELDKLKKSNMRGSL